MYSYYSPCRYILFLQKEQLPSAMLYGCYKGDDSLKNIRARRCGRETELSYYNEMHNGNSHTEGKTVTCDLRRHP